MHCTNCNLHKTCKQPVSGDGPTDTGLMLVGEGPGEEEDITGRPFVGKAGRELDGQYLMRFARVLRHEWYVTNVVKCRPPGNREPKPEETAICGRHLLKELILVQPRIIGALGHAASSFLLGSDVDMELLHGIPQRAANDIIIVPMYHPAAGLHDPSKMVHIQRDFEMLGRVVRGEVRPEDWRDEYPNPTYSTSSSIYNPGTVLDIMAIDTETYTSGRLFTVQWSMRPGTGVMVSEDSCHGDIRTALLIMHNALFDLPLLRNRFTIRAKVMDTMVMAYVLQDEPQGLKTLAYRHCGMQMSSFQDLVRPAQQFRSAKYLRQVVIHQWPLLTHVLVWDGDTPRLKKPWSMNRKAASIMKSFSREKNVDVLARWHKIPLEEGRQFVENTLGPMPKAGIEHVPMRDAITYACRDADATYRIFPKLWSRVKAYGLEEAFWIDMGIVDMIIDMMQYGMPTQPDKFRELASTFARHADDIESEITKLVGYYVNPGSSQQVSELLFKTLKLRSRKKSKKTGDDSTDQKYLEQMRKDHEVVGRILDWRKAKKLQTTYAEALPRLVDSAGRIHPSIKTTRTSTGRLSTASPNLQNIPVRSKEGRMIRECFIAPEGCTFLSLDYSQIELRTLAHESEDEVMLEAYRNDEDIHSKTASLVFGIPVAQLHPYNHRRPAKTCNFAVVYGITPEGLQDSLAREGADQAAWTVDRCKEFIDEWFRIYRGVKAYMDRQTQQARRFGYVRDMFGRIRHIPGVYSTIKSVVSGAIREAGNMPIQAGAQEIMKIAMSDLIEPYRQWAREGKHAIPIMQIHDDLLWEVDTRHVQEVYAVCKAVMENAVRLKVPVKVDGKTGPVWGHMSDIKEE